jgi:protein-S-isoprenylcysteine O-methyltransferase Ste14
MDLRQRLFRYRSYTPVPFLIVMVALARPALTGMLIGFSVVAAGESLRLWGVSIAGSETRTTGPVGGTFLITRGPFAHVRNPLYLGNMLMYAGFGLMSGLIWLSLVALLYFVWQYSLIVSLEEEYLLREFRDEYLRYCTAVPRFLPALRRYPPGSNPQPEPDVKRGVRSEKRTLQAIAILTLVLLAIWYVRG